MLLATNDLDDFVEDKCSKLYTELAISNLNKYNLIFPGSFNPLHYGHLGMVHHAESLVKSKALFEVCISHYDKVVYNKEDILRIKAQFDAIDRQIVFTRLPSFLQKAKYLKYSIAGPTYFIVGMDTMRRINDRKYYFDSDSEQKRVYQYLKMWGIQFLVYPRNSEKVELHKQLAPLCQLIDIAEQGVSSTQLREGNVK